MELSEDKTIEDNTGFFTDVNQLFWGMLKMFSGPVVSIYIGYKIYVFSTSNDSDFTDIILVIVLGGLGAVVITYLLALIAAPLIGLDKKKIIRFEKEKSVYSLLEIVHSASTGNIFTLACDAISRLGKLNTPLLEQALFKETCPIRSPFGNRIKSTENLRAGAAYCLGKLKQNSSAKALISALITEDDATVRIYMCSALGEIGDESALKLLEHLSLNDGDENVRKSAKEAIKKINEPVIQDL